MPDVEGLKAFLANIAVFGGLEDSTLDRLVSMLIERSFQPDEIVCREGETGRSMYVVRSGEVVVCRRGESGHLRRVVRLGPGEFFGEMTLIDIQPRSATVVVEKPTTLLALTNKDLYKLYQDDVAGYVMVLQNICRELSRRLRKADSRIIQIADDAEDGTTQIGRAPVKRPAG